MINSKLQNYPFLSLVVSIIATGLSFGAVYISYSSYSIEKNKYADDNTIALTAIFGNGGLDFQVIANNSKHKILYGEILFPDKIIDENVQIQSEGIVRWAGTIKYRF